ncbi:DEAD/DEAH box helicase [Cryobacterium sp. N19]|uniref:DEAD/DEAH box helicase n=1 Tax=Cryobacterium sp. N19 TaxID=2048288 RepID=UPI000CE3CFE7|nr:DEAD/DEAH box helicase [Cryobacterium sp. N19]
MSDATGLNPALEYHIVNSLGWNNLRPLQQAAVEPVRSGADCLLVAPTAGGKTEAAIFPLLSEMVDANWQGMSVLYVTPLRALLNNLKPRLDGYGHWLGRTVGLWHGDVPDGERKRILRDPPDILLTTPESLEAMLVSRRVDHHNLFRGVRAIVIDELHAFAGGDRGWHLLAVLERIQRLANAPIQRIGLSATIGNPDQMLTWMQGSGAARGRPARIVSEDVPANATAPEVTLDYVGSVANAALVLSRLYRGEKRLVFCESRAQAEDLAYELRQLEVTTFVSHSSLSADERRQSERAFAEARDCVIVATSTLELGIDIGDLDRMIQIDAPRSVASFLQRLGRTGRRPGTARNALFLAIEPATFLRAAGLLLLWRAAFVEPVVPPPAPLHIAAQQLLALALQEGRFGTETWRDWWGGLTLMDDASLVLTFLRENEFLVEDSGMLFIGPRAEKEFGRRYFMDLLTSFIADLELKVLVGRREIGSVSPLSLAGHDKAAAKPLLLAGRAWRIESVDWNKHEVLVTEDHEKGKVRWPSAPIAEGFELVRASRDVLLGATPEVNFSKRSVALMATIREEMGSTVDAGGLVLSRGAKGITFWTWAGLRANETLLSGLGYPDGTAADNLSIRLPTEISIEDIRTADVATALPVVSPEAVEGLKFSAALTPGLASATLAARFVDRLGAVDIVARPILVLNAID